ncbi:MAG: hypothetical protein OEV44_11680, partial [Spirochaetota bacterium]|nr:hypothetical protein [Spirochaetota bacterium]
LEGKIKVPLQDKEIKIHKPTGFFKKIANALTGGSLERTEEIENITIISFVQEVNRALRKNNITNIVKLSVDDQVIYEDLDGVEDDLGIALDNLSHLEKLDDIDEVTMILEHEDVNLKYVITIFLDRFHTPGKCPLEVGFKAIPKVLSRRENEEEEDFKQRLTQEVFVSKEQFKAFQEEMEETMSNFVKNLETSFQKRFNITDTQSDYRTTYVKSSNQPIHVTNYYYGYNPYDMYFSYMWWNMMMSYNYYPYNDVMVMNDEGSPVGTMTEGGTFSESVSPETASGENGFWGGSMDSAGAESAGGSWLDDTSFFGDSDSTDSSSSCSSCSSGSSCSSCSSCSGCGGGD